MGFIVLLGGEHLPCDRDSDQSSLLCMHLQRSKVGLVGHSEDYFVKLMLKLRVTGLAQARVKEQAAGERAAGVALWLNASAKGGWLGWRF